MCKCRAFWLLHKNNAQLQNWHFGLVWFVTFALATVTPAVSTAEPTPEQIEFFENRIRPVLVERCYECHNSSDTSEGGLALDHRAALYKGGESGPAIVAGQPTQSRLLKAIRHEISGQEMPEDGPKLDDRVIADFAKWIALGTADPRDEPPSADQLKQETSWEATRDRRKQWWSFQPIRNPPLPEVQDTSWSDHPIDRFVLAKLEQAGLKPAPAADPATLARRLSFALTGLPPTPAEVARFESDAIRPGAPGKSEIRNRLESPRFGERWARHWMDWIRFAESHGSEGDPPIPHAYEYRDYLIRALNANVPYDQLVREHVAGDLLKKPRINHELGLVESVIGTAHWRMVFHGFAPVDALEEKVRFTDDQINAFSKAFLGLTVSCARCHDHKFDPISQQDYYAMFGILGSCRPALLDANIPQRQQLHKQRLTELKQRIGRVVIDAWLDAAGSFRDKLLNPDDEWSKTIEGFDNPSQIFHTWLLMRREANAPEAFASAWLRRVQQWKNDRRRIHKHQQDNYAKRWRLDQPRASDDWFASGNGLGDKPSPAGEFVVASDGESVLSRIFPAGVYSHSLSSRHRAIFQSRRFKLDGQYDLWFRVAGDQESIVRYVVENYPRSGTVYPVSSLKGGNWIWQKYDMAYWDGDYVHLELTTAADAPVLVKDKGRSWFGIREVVLIKKGTPAPPGDLREMIEPLFDAAAARPPQSLEDLARCYEQTIATAVQAWRDGSLSDGQALFLDALLRTGTFPNTIQQIPAAKPLIDEYRRLESQVVRPSRVPGLVETESYDQPLYVRGDHKQPGAPVPRRFLEAIDPTPYRTSNSGRLQLANDVLRQDNPLTARVIVNRLWHHLCGQGIVATPDNFGRLGEEPTHPELLDYLAHQFIEEFSWSIKDMIQFIVTSKTWQQAAQPSAQALQVDPANRLLSHAHVRRLEAESIRDALLAVSGKLDLKMYGNPVDGKTPRRSVYVRVQRNSLDPLLRVFDFPEPTTAVGRRDVTNVPAQALTMMNDPLVHGYAHHWAQKIVQDTSLKTPEQRIQKMFQMALGRPAAADELKQMGEYLEDSETLDDRTKWTNVAHVIFNFKEFIYIK